MLTNNDSYFKLKSIMKPNIKKIKKEMKRNGWNYTLLAEKMEESKQWLSIVLSDRYKWNNFKTIEKFAKVFGVDEKDLVS